MPLLRPFTLARLHYPREVWRDDLLAALIVSVLLVPQALAYALVAGLPPAVGVCASLLPLLAYAALGSSPVNAVGPAAVLALMTGQALSAVDPLLASHADAALVLALETGLLLAAAALLKLDALSSLLSVPVMQGFNAGAAVSIVVSQGPTLLGSPAKGFNAPSVVRAWWQAGTTGMGLAAVFGLAALAMLWWARRHGKAFAARWLSPTQAAMTVRAAPLIVLMLAIVVAWAVSAPSHGVVLTGPLPALALQITWPVNAPALWWQLLPAAGAMALVAFVSSLAVTERLGLQRGEHIQPRRELAGLAAANLAAGLGGGMPVGGSLARTALNADAGVRTRMAGVWTALVMALVMALLAAPLAWLPKSVLAATIILAVASTIEWRAFGEAWRYARSEASLMVAVAVLVVLRDAQWALAVGVGASIALLLQRSSQPHAVLVGRMPGTEHYRNVRRYTAELTAGVVGIRIDESLLFTNARQLSGVVVDYLEQFPGSTRVLLQMSPVNRIDFSGLEALHALQDILAARGVRLDLSEVKGPVLDRLRAGGWHTWFTGRLFLSHHQGVLGREPMAAASASA
ncbi:MAG: hypothetical protein RLZZ618_1943 [Pseudomonadota bacterium]